MSGGRYRKGYNIEQDNWPDIVRGGGGGSLNSSVTIMREQSEPFRQYEEGA